MTSDTVERRSTLEMDEASLDAFAPFFLRLDAAGRILGVGRTLRKLIGDRPVLDASFFERFVVKKPRGVTSPSTLAKAFGKPISAAVKDGARLDLRGVAAPLSDGGVLLNFSLGARVAEVVEEFDLRSADFAPSDSTVDLLYMVSTQAQLLSDTTALMERLRQSQQEAELQAVTDALTGLPNRRALYARLAERPAQGALLQIDLDHFKTINDTYGHEAGDKALMFAAQVFEREFRREDFIARIGGDEFVAIVAGPVDRDAIAVIADRLVRKIVEPLAFAGSAHLGLSIGVRFFDAADDCDAERLLADADLALYAAKRDGRGRWALFDVGMRQRFETEAEALRLIRGGLSADAFTPFFQPQISMSAGAVVGVEVLARLRDPDGGVLTPAYFLDVAKRVGLLEQIDDQVRPKAFAQFAEWRAKGIAPATISINVTAERLADPTFADMLTMEVDRFDLAPHDVALEILETVLFEGDGEALAGAIDRLAEQGFLIHLDDFGTGHASMSSLLKLPVHKIKIDRSLIRELDQQEDLQTMARAIIDLAQDLGVATMAEGVETVGEMAALMALSCEQIQGYGAAVPMSALDLERWMVDRNASALTA